jgi:hypothetical protein
MALTAGMVVTSVNIALGAPLAGLWVGSLAAGDVPITMGAVGVFVVVTLAVGYVLVAVLGWMGDEHDRVTGRPRTVRRHVPWLRSLSGEREQYEGEPVSLSAMDRVLVAVVVAAILAFEIWFFFYSGSPLDQRSGRN